MNKSYRTRYEEWLAADLFDEETKKELLSIANNDNEINDRFYKELEFGTGGLRAIIGVGTNRLNKYTVRRITAGFAKQLIKEYGEKAKANGIVIAHDMRYGSTEFTLEAARTFAAMGIRTYLFREITSTPELSFAVPYLNAVGGIVITASHNPPKYNGYKIYDLTGCQATPKLANKIIREINEIVDYNSIAISSKDDQLITWLNDSVNDKFIESVKTKLIHPEIIEQASRDIKILYTPFHGTGRRPIFRVLKEIGFRNILTVEEQLTEDPEFKTLESPNPEEKSAFDLAIGVAKKNKVDIIIGTDPDCDRVGVVVRNGEKYEFLNGNQIGSLLVNYMITTNLDEINLKKNPYILKTIVTSELGAKIANKYGVASYDTLTGFKYIGEKINEIGTDGEFIMGYEESYGYLVGTHARDKDGVGSTALVTEMAAYYYVQGKNLIEVLEDIYTEFGFFKEELISLTFEGQTGVEKIKNMMTNYRNLDYDKMIKYEVKMVKDYSKGIDGLPKADVLKFFLKNGAWCAIRPSGTEPKIKFYIGAHGNSGIDAEEKINLFKELLEL